LPHVVTQCLLIFCFFQFVFKSKLTFAVVLVIDQQDDTTENGSTHGFAANSQPGHDSELVKISGGTNVQGNNVATENEDNDFMTVVLTQDELREVREYMDAMYAYDNQCCDTVTSAASDYDSDVANATQMLVKDPFGQIEYETRAKVAPEDVSILVMDKRSGEAAQHESFDQSQTSSQKARHGASNSYSGPMSQLTAESRIAKHVTERFAHR
jgi:hypothetical protein